MKVLIVDDEPLIHVSIEFNLKEFAESELEIFHAYTGTEMIQKMESTEIDIALVDIRMPGMDGLAAISASRKRWPKTHYYIMSGFSEFEYAREAIKLNVVDYLLKPLSPEQLQEIITAVRQENTNENDQIRDSFHAWLVGTLHKHDVSTLYSQKYFSALMLFCYDNLDVQFQNWLPDPLRNKLIDVITAPCWEGQLVMVYSRHKETVKDVLHSLPYKEYPAGVTCFFSTVSADPADLSREMHLMLDSSPIRVFWGISQRYQSRQLFGILYDDLVKAREWIELRDSFLDKRYADFVAKTSTLIPSLNNLSPTQYRHLVEFLNAFADRKIEAPFSPEKMAKYLTDVGESLIRSEGGSERIDAVIDYIQKHYCEDISVSQLSAQFDLSPNYLSSLLKKKLDLSFVDYLTSLRIGKSKELLISTNLSVREIGEAVGYYSQSYFTKIFIKKENCTPGEYRKKNGKK